MLRAASFLGHPHAEQTGGPEDQYQDEDAEDVDPGPLMAAVAVGDRLHQADEQAAERGAVDVADAPEDRGREREEADLVAKVEPDGVEVEAEDHAACRGQ